MRPSTIHPSSLISRPGVYPPSGGTQLPMVAYTSPMQDDKPLSSRTASLIYSSASGQQSLLSKLKPLSSCAIKEEMSNIVYPHSLTNTALCASSSPRHSNRFSKSISHDTTGNPNSSTSLISKVYSNYSSSVYQNFAVPNNRDSTSSLHPLPGSHVAVYGTHQRGQQRKMENRLLGQSLIGSKSVESLTETSLLSGESYFIFNLHTGTINSYSSSFFLFI